MIFRRIVQLASVASLMLACGTGETPAPSPVPTHTPPIAATSATPFLSYANKRPPRSATPSATPTPEPPRTLTICLRAEPDTLFIYGGAMYVASVIREAIYDGPIDMRSFEPRPVILEKLPSPADGDAVLEPVPVRAGDRVVDDGGEVVQLAEGVRVRPAGCRQPECAVAYDGGPLEMDQLSATFRLLPGIEWSDGHSLTAADSVFSFQRAQQAKTRYGREWMPSGTLGLVPDRAIDPIPRTASYTALDPLTVRWVGLPGFLDPHYRTNFFTPLPKHQLGHLSAEQLMKADESARLPLGWGPYILKGWTPGDRIVAERNPDYFRADEGLPFFDRLVFRFAGADVERNLTDLQAGRCDLLTLDTYLDAQLARVLELEEAGALELYANPGRVWEHLDFGINPSPDVDRPDYFEDARMRQAVAHCVDRQRLVDQVHGGLTIVPHAYIPPAHPLSAQADLPEYPFDPELGMGLLEAMGWRDYDGDGVREAHGVEGIPDGARLQFSYETTTSQQRAQIAGLIAEDLATCGIVVTVVQTPPSEFFAETPFAPLYGRRFDLVQFAWFTGSIPPCDLFLSDGLRSEAGAGADQGATGYTNPAYDVACRAAMAALPGTEDYTVHHLEALRIFARDLPVLSLAMRPYLSAARPELLGLLLDSSEMAETWSIEEFRLEP